MPGRKAAPALAKDRLPAWKVVSAIVIKEDTDLDVPAGVSGVVLGNVRRSTNHTAAI